MKVDTLLQISVVLGSGEANAIAYSYVSLVPRGCCVLL
jgi:hypothetical protein